MEKAIIRIQDILSDMFGKEGAQIFMDDLMIAIKNQGDSQQSIYQKLNEMTASRV